MIIGAKPRVSAGVAIRAKTRATQPTISVIIGLTTHQTETVTLTMTATVLNRPTWFRASPGASPGTTHPPARFLAAKTYNTLTL